ncbi:hypothetical protein DNTS_023894 [Danionella cerebrum]|uniref:Uncharacterized protein n=1 Tax=Danionella cerebrum TaxID=2873325 RepID=A0A553MUV7_9TELE|nr:hypothetical protein DNTS_023894 [Danionella translucida]
MRPISLSEPLHSLQFNSTLFYSLLHKRAGAETRPGAFFSTLALPFHNRTLSHTDGSPETRNTHLSLIHTRKGSDKSEEDLRYRCEGVFVREDVCLNICFMSFESLRHRNLHDEWICSLIGCSSEVPYREALTHGPPQKADPLLSLEQEMFNLIDRRTMVWSDPAVRGGTLRNTLTTLTQSRCPSHTYSGAAADTDTLIPPHSCSRLDLTRPFHEHWRNVWGQLLFSSAHEQIFSGEFWDIFVNGQLTFIAFSWILIG